MNIIEDMFTLLIETWGAMIGAVLSVIPKIISFVLWIVCALIILPCVFVAGNFFPAWQDWGETF